MQFIITAYDGEGMSEKRAQVRPRHLENINRIRETGRVLCAGGILNEEQRPVGSVLILDFANREQLDQYLESEPYITEKVWQNIRVEPMNAVFVDNEKTGQ